MNATTVPGHISAFAARVREELADLPTQEVEELTEGLEADLSEEYAGDQARQLPSPEDYAYELRTAAGLPERGERSEPTPGVRGALGQVRQHMQTSWAEVQTGLANNPTATRTLGLLTELAPLWWVLRAYVVTWSLTSLFVSAQLTQNAGFLLIFVLAAVVSVQWGRGRWTFAGSRWVKGAANAIALVMVVPVALITLTSPNYENLYYSGIAYGDALPMGEDELGDGLAIYGITNIYAYDAQGQPLRDIQLFDQDGRPVAVRSGPDDGGVCIDEMCDSFARAQSARLVNGAPAWNVFPLRFTMVDEEGNEERSSDLNQGDPLLVPPFVVVPAVDVLDAQDVTEDEPNITDEADVTKSPGDQDADPTSGPPAP